MADIKLGISGAEYTLPQTRWSGGDQPESPIAITMNIDKAQMLDGSVRYNFRNTHQRRWTLDFPEVTAEELWEFTYLCSLNQALRYQNNWYATTWYDVVISEFSYFPLNATSTSADIRYSVQLVLDEVI
jgi:hypothetical protein